jgi:hypothetical protein
MANMDHIRKRGEAVAPQTAPRRTVKRCGRWWRGMAGGVLGLGLILGVLRLPAVGAPLVGNGSCSGPFGCLNNIGSVGDHSCNSRFACDGNRGAVGADACNGEGACLSNAGTVGNGACLGRNACFGNTGTIGTDQCIGDDSCPNNTANFP